MKRSDIIDMVHRTIKDMARRKCNVIMYIMSSRTNLSVRWWKRTCRWVCLFQTLRRKSFS